MQRSPLQAYEIGYGDGLQEALAELLENLLASVLTPRKSSQPEISFSEEYHKGFSEGLKDGTEVLSSVGKTTLIKHL